MPQELATLAIGFISGVLSGMFGIGGGVVTTPAIRLLLGAPALVAVGTPLVAILPSAVTGAISYARRGIADLRTGATIGLVGAPAAIAGAWLTRLVGGTAVLLATAALIVYVAADMALQATGTARGTVGLKPQGSDPADGPPRAGRPRRRPGPAALAVAGVLTGLYSGFLGLGGGFVLVPLLTRWLRFDIKTAIATSLTAISLIAVPGAITHALLGHMDWGIALWLVVGAVPGAALGARVTQRASARAVQLSFALLLGAVGLWLATSELARWLG